MGLTTILGLVGVSYRAAVVAYRLAKRLAPVLAVLAVLFAKLASGDFTGLPELLTALIAAATAVWNGEKVAQLTSSMRLMQGSPR